MNAQQLKNSILQEAIEGRLVPQDPNDEPASVLLERIREEKKRLVKEGKLKKKDLEVKPISEDEIPFEIPESWEWVRLEDITIYISRGKSPVYSDIMKYPIVAQKCNQWSGFSLEKAKFADPKTIEKYAEERLLRDGDLLWNSTGLGTLGRMSIYDSSVNQYGWAVADSHVTVIRTLPTFCDYKYLFFYFASAQVQNVIEDKADGSTKQKELYQETVRKYEVPLPPYSEQQRIVAKIEELMPKIDEYGKAQTALDKLNEELPELLKKSILQEAIEGRLVPQDPNDEPASVLLDRIRAEKARLVKEGKLKKKDLEETPISEDEIPFDIPDSWEWVKFGEIFNVRSAKRIHQTDWQSYGVPFFRGRELIQLIKTGEVNSEIFIKEELYESLKKYGIPAKDDILISAVGTIGRVYIVKGTNPFYYKDAYILCCENIGKIYPQYIAMTLTSPYLQKLIHQDSMATTVAQLTIEKAKSLVIPFPPLAEQKRIVGKIEQLMKEIVKLK